MRIHEEIEKENIQIPEKAMTLAKFFEDQGCDIYIGPIYYATGRDGVSVVIMKNEKTVVRFCFLDNGILHEIDSESRYLELNDNENYPRQVSEFWLAIGRLVIECVKTQTFDDAVINQYQDMTCQGHEEDNMVDISKEEYWEIKTARGNWKFPEAEEI